MQKFYKIDTRSARTVKRRMFINIIIICSKYYYSNMVALTGIHENVMLSNLSSIGTKGAIESVRIHSLSVF